MADQRQIGTACGVTSLFATSCLIADSYFRKLSGRIFYCFCSEPSPFTGLNISPQLGRIMTRKRSLDASVIWVTGQIDFEVLQRSNAEYFWFHHEDTRNLDAPHLQTAFIEFLQKMSGK